jgi:hypothetical protein
VVLYKLGSTNSPLPQFRKLGKLMADSLGWIDLKASLYITEGHRHRWHDIIGSAAQQELFVKIQYWYMMASLPSRPLDKPADGFLGTADISFETVKDKAVILWKDLCKELKRFA